MQTTSTLAELSDQLKEQGWDASVLADMSVSVLIPDINRIMRFSVAHDSRDGNTFSLVQLKEYGNGVDDGTVVGTIELPSSRQALAVWACTHLAGAR